ncbi:hypothetical protein WN51_03585 [Melipona quadrifasciata]|uniref:Uncharacterized protein n=1 Tax=Melipona quadrifasciata TaxID=166423 RepID=A0A0N0U488_9HYME|nr:hypothetical protein WN51_03585 [Melipona quadrifasciata]
MPEMETQREWTSLQLLQSPLGSVPGLVTTNVTNNEQDTAEVIKELKRMTLLKKFSISVRADCDEILRQLSLTNKKLEELHVSNCTGSTSKLYLRSGYLIRILERCRNLHTINILGSRFRGRKFYRLLGGMGPRLRSVYAPATKSQFCTFIKYARQISETDRETICSMYDSAKSKHAFAHFWGEHDLSILSFAWPTVRFGGLSGAQGTEDSTEENASHVEAQ